MKKYFKSILCLTLSATMFTTALTPVLASAKQENLINKNSTYEINDDDLTNLLNELSNTKWDNTELNNNEEKGIVSTSIKAVAKWIKQNFPKVVKVVKKYAPKYVQAAGVGKAVSQYLDKAVDGVYEFDESIDEFIYDVVNMLVPSLNYETKKIISNGIRLVSPF